MLKVVCVVDKDGTALDRLGRGVAKYHGNLNYKVLPVHPKRPDAKQLADFEREAIDADIIDYQYYKSAEMLRSRYAWLKDKKSILTHNNPYGVEDSTWNDYDLNVGNNSYIYHRLGKITDAPVEYIPLTVDTDFWQYNPDWEPNNNVIMVANRIESKKGILPVAIACAELGIKLHLVGAVSDAHYMDAIAKTGWTRFYEQISNEELRQLYYKSSLHICNSVDGFESGTLPILEAMLCGVPVMTRKIGHVPELYNGENMVIYDGDPEDVEAITQLLQQTMADKKQLLQMRDKAWNSAKVRSHERRAYMYQKLYRQVLHPNQTPVSIVLTIYDKPEIIRKSLDAISKQTYRNIELIVADDNPESNFGIVKEMASYVDFPVKYMHTARRENDYGLARARNMATIEATGEIMVYMDQRQVPDPDAVKMFVENIKPNYWLYGNKGVRKEFVENFSAVYRTDAIRVGMFNERIDKYGGASEELRKRIRSSGISTEFVESAKANPTGKSSNRNRKRQEIIAMKNRIFKMGFPE